MTLKEFHSHLFSGDSVSTSIPDYQAFILNTGLNAFLASGERETMLLEALRQNKGVHLRFKAPMQTSEYQIAPYPGREIAFQLQPEVREVAITVDIQPLLDGPIAFKIKIQKGNDTFDYNVNWSGELVF